MCTHCVSPCRNGMILFILGDVKRRTRFVIRVLLSLMTADFVILCVQNTHTQDFPTVGSRQSQQVWTVLIPPGIKPTVFHYVRGAAWMQTDKRDVLEKEVCVLCCDGRWLCYSGSALLGRSGW